MQAQATDLAAQYPHLQQGQGAKIAAVNIRRMLKSAFPGVKFSVRTEYGSMMDAVTSSGKTAPHKPLWIKCCPSLKKGVLTA